MELVTHAAGKCTRILISKSILMEALGDLENVPLPLDVTDSEPFDTKGTTITLRHLIQNYPTSSQTSSERF
ncbi:MAG: hypothetical protein HC845_14265 [Akkermansiaceae bacterium]|nr:hypothetical protein [Akkermansiaceae bacterium]